MSHFPNALGQTIFETYPAGTLALLGIKQHYKGGRAHWQGNRWESDGDSSEGLVNILNELNIIGIREGGQPLTDDKLDAILAAIPLLCKPWLMGSSLMKHSFLAKEAPIDFPKGFILCGDKFWQKIVLLNEVTSNGRLHYAAQNN